MYNYLSSIVLSLQIPTKINPVLFIIGNSTGLKSGESTVLAFTQEIAAFHFHSKCRPFTIMIKLTRSLTKTSRKPEDTQILFISGNSTGPEMLSLKSGESTVLAFTLEERDIGGTLAVELALISHRVRL